MTKLDQLLSEIEESKPDEVLVSSSFDKNENDYWEAHAQFGSDPELRLKWFHDVGYDQGFYHAQKHIARLVKALRLAIAQRNAAVLMLPKSDEKILEIVNTHNEQIEANLGEVRASARNSKQAAFYTEFREDLHLRKGQLYFIPYEVKGE